VLELRELFGRVVRLVHPHHLHDLRELTIRELLCVTGCDEGARSVIAAAQRSSGQVGFDAERCSRAIADVTLTFNNPRARVERISTRRARC
jgi:hypothetical protein